MSKTQHSEDEFDALTYEQQNEVYATFLAAHPEHQDNIDNGQDLGFTLYCDPEFCAWMGWKI